MNGLEHLKTKLSLAPQCQPQPVVGGDTRQIF